MTHMKSSGLQSTSHCFYSPLCTRNFPHNRKAEEEEFGCSMESSSTVTLNMRHLMKACVTKNKMQSPKNEVHKSLKQEILELDKKLQDQFQVRSTLEKALGDRSSTHGSDVQIHKPVTELIKEIAVIEVEIMHLEQNLLGLYQKSFDGQSTTTASPPVKNGRSKSPLSTTPQSRVGQTSKTEALAVKSSPHLLENSNGAGEPEDNISDSQLLPFMQLTKLAKENAVLEKEVRHLEQYLLTLYRKAFDGKATTSTPQEESLPKPLAKMENASSNITSSLPHDHTLETPNRLSEDIIRCISTIFCMLAEPPLVINNGLCSPTSSVSSVSGFSLREQFDLLTPGFKKNLPFDVRLDNPYSTVVEVPWIYRDSQKLGDIDDVLHNLRSKIERLDEVDPRKLKHEEKLAFWINIHNALVMHAYFAYGIPHNNVKRVYLLLKASYNIGGHKISADTIQSSILRCPMSRPRQWLRLLLSSRTKFKTKDEPHAYAIDHSEPLLHFALCSGSHSDPVVRVYTPKRIMQELESAKEEYIRTSFGVHKNEKILLPKIIESFAKNSGLCSSGVLEMIELTLPESLRKSLKKCQTGKSHKPIQWIPHNFSFRYLISKELVK